MYNLEDLIYELNNKMNCSNDEVFDKLSELIRVSGMITMLQFAGADVSNQNYFFSTIDRRRVDSIGSDRIKNIISSGFYMIQYPKAQLTELLAIKLSKQELNNLIDSEYYYDQQGSKLNITTQKNILSNQVKSALEEIINGALDSIDGISVDSGENILSFIGNEVKKDQSNTLTSKSSLIHYNNMFKSENKDNLYELIKNNESKFKNN